MNVSSPRPPRSWTRRRSSGSANGGSSPPPTRRLTRGRPWSWGGGGTRRSAMPPPPTSSTTIRTPRSPWSTRRDTPCPTSNPTSCAPSSLSGSRASSARADLRTGSAQLSMVAGAVGPPQERSVEPTDVSTPERAEPAPMGLRRRSTSRTASRPAGKHRRFRPRRSHGRSGDHPAQHRGGLEDDQHAHDQQEHEAPPEDPAEDVP